MSRLRRLTRPELDVAQGAFFDALAARSATSKILHGIGADGGLDGPSNARLRSPVIGGADQDYGEAVRRHSELSERTRELAILVVAYFVDCQYELFAHEWMGRAAGLTDGQLATLRAGGVPADLPPDEAVAVRSAQSMMREGQLPDVLYEEAVRDLGERRLYELVLCVGYYAQLALQLRVFRVDAPAAVG
jgi:AhpD family alkylhydroperoxidase